MFVLKLEFPNHLSSNEISYYLCNCLLKILLIHHKVYLRFFLKIIFIGSSPPTTEKRWHILCFSMKSCTSKYIFTLQTAAAFRNLKHQILSRSHRKNLYTWWNLWHFLQHKLICAYFPICDFSPALMHLCSFVILIHRSRRSRFYQHLGPSWATLYSIFLNAFFIWLFKRRSCERKVTLYRMAIPLLKNFGSVQCSVFMIVVT